MWAFRFSDVCDSIISHSKEEIPFTEKTCKVAVKLGPKLLLHALQTLSLQSAKVDDEESRCDPNSLIHIRQRFHVVPSNCKCHQTERIICLHHGKVNGKVANHRSLMGTFVGRTAFS